MWHFSHETGAWRPVSGQEVLAWSNPGAGFHACSVWHEEHARPANWPRCSSLWHDAQA